MIEFLRLILHIIASFFKPRTKLVAEILVLRQQLNVLRRQVSKRPQLRNTDRFLFVWLYRWVGSTAATCRSTPAGRGPMPTTFASTRWNAFVFLADVFATKRTHSGRRSLHGSSAEARSHPSAKRL